MLILASVLADFGWPEFQTDDSETSIGPKYMDYRWITWRNINHMINIWQMILMLTVFIVLDIFYVIGGAIIYAVFSEWSFIPM
jgi:hypothetical protein